MEAYLYHADGQPVMEADWYQGRFAGRSHACARLERMLTEGETLELHAGHGVYHEYRVEVADSQAALLMRTGSAHYS